MFYFLNFRVQSWAGLLPVHKCEDGDGRLFVRRHLAPPGIIVDHLNPGCVNRPPSDIYVSIPQSMPVVKPSPALFAAPPAPALTALPLPLPTTMSSAPAPIPPRVSHELECDENVKMPKRTHGETCVLRDTSREIPPSPWSTI